MTGKKVLPIGLARCDVTNKRALKRFIVSSSISQTQLLEEIAIRSASSKFCTPKEATTCLWSMRKVHPDDIRNCRLTGLPVDIEFIVADSDLRLRPLVEILDGVRRNADETQLWDVISERIAAANKGGKHKIVASVRSPSGEHVVACAEVKTMMGFRVRQVGAMFEIATNSIVGRVASGKRDRGHWVEQSE